MHITVSLHCFRYEAVLVAAWPDLHGPVHLCFAAAIEHLQIPGHREATSAVMWVNVRASTMSMQKDPLTGRSMHAHAFHVSWMSCRAIDLRDRQLF